MGGGEVARLLGRGQAHRVARAAFVAAVTPYLLKTEDNPGGVPRSSFDEILTGLQRDRPKFLAGFGQKFFGNGLLDRNVSNEMLLWSSQMALMGSLRATIECAKSFATTDFRGDLPAIKIPTLFIHGTADQTVPIESSARAAVSLIQGARLVEYDGAPHGLFATHKDQLNADLLDFVTG
jgi:non-heme chloroperoxidase